MSQEVHDAVNFMPLQISDAEFAKIRDLVYSNFGINLTEAKRTLVAGRLQKLLRTKGLRNLGEYYDFIKADSSGKALSELANCISTNHTFFNRENEHFNFFTNRVLPWVESTVASRDLRLWCAASSSGEEPYFLVMLMLEYFQERYASWDAGILASDISETALQKAVRGVYEDENVSSLPANLKNKYFNRVNGNQWEVNANVKREVLFRRLNLMSRPFPFKKNFHAIFCRNVMIYFDQKNQK